MKHWEETPLRDILDKNGTTYPAPRPDSDFEEISSSEIIPKVDAGTAKRYMLYCPNCKNYVGTVMDEIKASPYFNTHGRKTNCAKCKSVVEIRNLDK